jgi:streptogramin lyase
MRSVLGLGFCLPLVLAGCAISPTAVSTPDAGLAIQGIVRGGQQPIAGAHVFLYAANTTGYGGAGIAPSSSNASISLLTAPGYVVTDANGGFSITGAYSCTPDTQVYLYAVGGNPGAGVNNAAGLLAVLGNCPSAGNFLTATPYIAVNEVSTIAAAYAFAGFASDATHVSSSSSALAKIGIKNAFANAANLASLSTGTALATTPNGNGTVPQAEIYALANILASCINSDGTVTNPSTCYTLLNNAQSAGSSGTIPTDTATAAINIAHNPGSNVAALFGLASSSPPFATSFAQPNDFTIGLQFTGGGVNDPHSVAVDGLGNVWVTNPGSLPFSVSEFSSSGVPISPSGGFTGGGLDGPNGIAIDPNGNAWVANGSGNSVTEFSSAGAALSPSVGGYTGGLNVPYGIAVDGSNNVWVTNSGGTSVTKFTSAGALVSEYTTGNVNFPRSIAIDNAGNAWVANAKNGSVVTEFSNSGTLLSAAGYTGGGLNIPHSIAIDHSGNAWLADSNGLPARISEFSSAGSALSGSGYTDGGLNSPEAIAIDGAGSVWVGNLSSNLDGTNGLSEFTNAGVAITPSKGYLVPVSTTAISIAPDASGNLWVADPNALYLTEMVGVSTPVVTPIAVGARDNTLGTRP